MIIIISLEALTWLVFAVLGGVVIFANATRLLALLFAVLGAGIWMTYVLIAFANRNRKGRAADAPGIWGATSYYNPQTGEVYSEADGHWLADYEKGQVFYPAADEAEPEAACRNEGDSFIDRAYYPVRLGDGKTGYVFSGRKNGCNVAVYYFDDSALVQQTQARLRRLRWYGALPEPVLQGCAGLFERLHPSLRMQLTRQAD